ncbi:MAG: hypothetical protein BroJett018_39730 [Chloroflexota bacterium]|nr:MAG: hypothetical protein BroJett018_39730 [Chloroflexota bacterium]
MSDQAQEPIFFHEAHCAFLENRDADVLNWKVMRPNLYWQKTGWLMLHEITKWPVIFLGGVSGVAFGGGLTLFMTLATIQLIGDIITHGLPDWSVIIDNIKIGIFFVIFWLGGIVGMWAFKNAVLMAWWTDRRLYNLFQQTVQEGQLIRGYIESSQRAEKALIPEIIYRFNNPTGESIESNFFPDPQSYSVLDYPSGTPVWVLYLDDKICVLL